jgi:signal transduction histidine kinase
MTRHRRSRYLAFGALLGRRSARFRLTALYCCLFLPSGALLVVITYVFIVLVQRPTNVAHLVRSFYLVRGFSTRSGAVTDGPMAQGGGTRRLLGGTTTVILPGHVMLDASEFLVGACIVLIAMIAISVLLGWLVAGRVLRPLRVMTVATRQISEHNLNERLALGGPADELKDLGDTIDGLLGRLEAAFDSQRRFVANASHELRTPLMLSQTILQVAVADPSKTLGSLQAACQEAVEVGRDQAQLIEALLVLARSQRGLDHREPVDLAALVEDALKAHGPSAAERGLQVHTATADRAEVPGDAHLIYRLVSNIVDNAVRYNTTGGRVEVKVATSTREATLTVANTGPPVPPDQVTRLLEPFQRAIPDRTANPNGLGLGLSIVSDIAKAHGAGLEVCPRREGGLTVAVSFPVEATQVPKLDGNRLAPKWHGRRVLVERS